MTFVDEAVIVHVSLSGLNFLVRTFVLRTHINGKIIYLNVWLLVLDIIRDSSVSKVAGYMLDYRGLIPGKSSDFSLGNRCHQTSVLRPTQPSIKWVLECEAIYKNSTVWRLDTGTILYYHIASLGARRR